MFFWNSLAFTVIQGMLASWSLVPLTFPNPAWTCGSSWFMYCWTLAWRLLSITLLVCAAAAAAKSLQLCPTLCDPIDGSPPGSPVPGIFQAKILEWVAISFSRGSSRPRDRTRVSSIVGRRFTIWATREALWKQMCRPQISNFEGDLYKVTLFKALFWLQVFPNYL